MENLHEKSPPGWGGTVLAMKKHHPKIKNPWALAWSMKNKGDEAHYKNDPEGSKSKKEPEKKVKFKEWLSLQEKCNCKCKKCDKDCPCHKKGKLKYAFNVEGEPVEIEE